MNNTDILQAALVGYKLQSESISSKITEIENILKPRRGRKPSVKTATPKAKRTFSDEARARMKAAQQLRWKKAKSRLKSVAA